MSNPLKSSELILRPNGAIYHLDIPPGVLSPTIITVGDPDRVESVTKHFDTITFQSRKREFYTVVGTYKGLLLTVISTGIGTDNIDIVLNELDAVFNIDFKTRCVKQHLQKLTFVRLGTSGIIEADSDFNLGEIVYSGCAFGFDGLCQFYEHPEIQKKTLFHLNYYHAEPSDDLVALFSNWRASRTMTMPGFYGPQNRQLRIQHRFEKFEDLILQLEAQNLEMETAGIYAMSKLLGHDAISIQVLLADRPRGTFCKHPQEAVDKMIVEALDILSKNAK